MIVAILPARGGSKRIKNKNIINIGGKPMIHHTIQILLGKQIKINTVEKSAARELIDTYIQKEKEYKSIFVYLYTFK